LLFVRPNIRTKGVRLKLASAPRARWINQVSLWNNAILCFGLLASASAGDLHWPAASLASSME
jgi:hypothetical protein